MAASARILHLPNHRLPLPCFLKNPYLDHPFRNLQPLQSPFRSASLSHHPRTPPLFKFLAFNGSSFRSPSHNFSFSHKHFASIFSGTKDCYFQWNYACVGEGNNGVSLMDDKGPEVAVVLLGWLGAKTKHLRRYVELYTGRGIHAVTFVASVRDVLSVNLGRKLEERIAKLAHELDSWLSKEDGRERCLVFHTFSNTGWLAYGAILQNWKDRNDLLGRIRGCVVDSGGDPNIDPKVWAAGFSTAILKKNSSSTSPSGWTGDGAQPTIGIKGTEIKVKKPFIIETFLLSALENLFSYLLNFPDVNQRLTKILSGLSKNQPPCPQLYLYSSSDKVIPFQRVELFFEDQRQTGKQVFSFNFVSSPHVDHYREFLDIYSSQIHSFLKECRLVKVENVETT